MNLLNMNRDNSFQHDNSKIPLIEENKCGQIFPLTDCSEAKESLNEHSYPININSPDNFDETNIISTSKYKWYNCIPKILIEQFSKMANIYFLLIAIMQSIDELSISRGKPVILLPFAVVIFVNGLKDFLEDWKRKRADDEENERNIEILDYEEKVFVKKTWKEVKLGSVIKVYENEFFPADVILLTTNKSNSLNKANDGICYIESKNLDGETSLKYKQCQNDISNFFSEEKEIIKIKGKIDCEQPNEFIYEFNAKMHIINMNHNSVFSIDNNNFILRGCSLKQTCYIYGVVVYIGHNSKIMKNSPSARSKSSKLESIMNLQIITVFLIQFFLSILGAILFFVWHSNKDKLQYLGLSDKNISDKVFFFIFRVGTWILIFTNLVPISLLVTLEMVKYIQGIFISWDYKLYSFDDVESGCKVQTSTLNEELGQVKVIFSDKTGTLTKNNMDFRTMSIGTFLYGTFNNSEISNVNFSNNQFNDIFAHIKDESHQNYNNIKYFMLCLSICHSVFTKDIQNNNNKNILYQASSPDELSLVSAARFFGFKFIKREVGNKIILKINNIFSEYIVTHILEFTSERKRMSVIVKCPEGRIYLFCKGADSIIKQLISDKINLITRTEEYVKEFANSGLRTLMIAYKELQLKEYEEFDRIYQTEINKDNKNLNHVYDSIETSLNLLGSTGIEDQLQDEVENTIYSFVEIGIKLWVLTGDKVGTAISIAHSCNLFTKETEILEVKENITEIEIENNLNNFNDILSSKYEINNYGLVICSNELAKIISNKKLTYTLYTLSLRCNSILCCRVSPKQKAEIVTIVKNLNPDIVTLAIGDGANDVNMITSAHIGIGIRGVEGRQASRASDYSISQFKCLKRLLLVHGRESYRKNSFIVVYNFYKNIIFVIPQFWFGFFSLFSGQPLYDPWIYQLYNMLFTCFPICWYGIYDKEYSYDNTLEIESKHYLQGMKDKLFHSGRFWKWIIIGAFQSLILFFFSFYANNSSTNADGFMLDVIGCGSITYSSVVIITNVKIFLFTSTHTLFSFLLFTLSILSYYIVMIIMSYFTKFDNFDNSYMLFSSTPFYLSSFIMIVMCILFDEGVGKILRLFNCVKDLNFISIYNKENIKCLESNRINIRKQSKKEEYICQQ